MMEERYIIDDFKETKCCLTCRNWNVDNMDEVTARDKENEQLRAQVAAMREALRKAREAIMAAWSGGSVNAAMDKTSKALTAIDKAIGGKEE